MNQYTLKKEYQFEGKGLHTGVISKIQICPAAADFGIRFLRTDCGVEIPALASNVSRTDRSTTLSVDGTEVVTVEHLLSALTGLGVDNALIKIDNKEVPILDGSAYPYMAAILPDGLCDQGVERKYIQIEKPLEITSERTGSVISITPSDSFSLEVEVDFNSKVLGIQTVSFSEKTDFLSEIAPCRTFVFFHELEALVSYGLVKGGDVNNAIVVVEHPINDDQIAKMCTVFDQDKIGVTPSGYLNNLTLRFPNECGRHKLLDLIGDLRLCGGFLKAKVVAYKPGHTINTNAAKAILSSL